MVGPFLFCPSDTSVAGCLMPEVSLDTDYADYADFQAVIAALGRGHTSVAGGKNDNDGLPLRGRLF